MITPHINTLIGTKIFVAVIKKWVTTQNNTVKTDECGHKTEMIRIKVYPILFHPTKERRYTQHLYLFFNSKSHLMFPTSAVHREQLWARFIKSSWHRAVIQGRGSEFLPWLSGHLNSRKGAKPALASLSLPWEGRFKCSIDYSSAQTPF